MRLINLTRNRKKRVLIMLKGLVPEYNSIRITKIKGLPIVVFKKQWWKFWTRYTVNITDICISEIPKRLDQMAQDKNLGKYRDLFNNIIFDIVAYKENAHTRHIDIVDYLWEYYNKIYNSGSTTLPLSKVKVLVKSNYLPIPFTKPVIAFNINSIIKEIPEYLTFKELKKRKLQFPKYTPPIFIKYLFLTVPYKVKEVYANFGLRTALS